MNAETTPQRLLSTKEAVDYFDGKIKRQTLNNWRTQGRGPKFLRIGGKVLYPIDELDRFKSDSLYSSTSNYKPN